MFKSFAQLMREAENYTWEIFYHSYMNPENPQEISYKAKGTVIYTIAPRSARHPYSVPQDQHGRTIVSPESIWRASASSEGPVSE